MAEARRPASGSAERAVRLWFLVLGSGKPRARDVAALSPGSFLSSVGGFGARNDHYVRDASTLYLALGMVLLAAIARPPWGPPVLLFATLQYGLHLVNHILDVADADPRWVDPVDVVLLAIAGAFVWTPHQDRLARRARGQAR